MTVGESYTVVVSSSIVDASGIGIDASKNSAAFSTGVKGKVDNSGAIDITDVLLVIDIIFGVKTPSAAELYAANVDATSQSIDIADLLGIIDIIFGT